jgi:MarR family transcriptional regulator for hemolysin
VSRDEPPLGLLLARSSRAVTHAFEQALAAAGGSVPVWQVLLLVRARQWHAQSHMAEALGISAATLTHHLSALERQGVVRRWRDEGNRRVQQVALTEPGEQLFLGLREIARRHDERLRAELTPEEAETLAALLRRLELAFRS